jgi:hypothetical protein
MSNIFSEHKISFNYDDQDTITSEIRQGIPTIQVIPSGCDVQNDAFGMILVERNPGIEKITVDDYAKFSIDNL